MRKSVPQFYPADMRTAVTLGDDVAAAVEELRRERAIDMGLPRVAVDDMAGLLHVLEGGADPRSDGAALGY